MNKERRNKAEKQLHVNETRRQDINPIEYSRRNNESNEKFYWSKNQTIHKPNKQKIQITSTVNFRKIRPKDFQSHLNQLCKDHQEWKQNVRPVPPN